MGAIAPSKQPRPRTVVKKDGNEPVKLYAKGGSTNWIAGAIKKPGALHKQMGVPQGQKIPAKKLAAAASKPGKLGQRAEGKDPEGGLNAKGRASYNAANPGKPGLKAPQPEGGSRRDSFCARMTGMKKKLTSAKTANDPNSRINKSLRAWRC